jgi:ribosomal protein L16 Arg81 hydroxylase
MNLATDAILAPQAPSLGALTRLLAPLDVDAFARDHWAKKSCLVRGGREKLSSLLPGGLSLETLNAALDDAGSRAILFAYTHDANGDVVNIRAERLVAEALRAAGHTLFVDNSEEVLPSLGDLAAAVRRELGYPGIVRTQAFFGSQRSSLGLHYDTFSVFSIQCDGKKRWLYEDVPALACPRSTSADAERRTLFAEEHPWSIVAQPDRSAMKEVVLEPGDVLYVPAGAWHATESSEGESLSVSLAFVPLGFDQILAQVLRRTIDTLPWRQSFPISSVVSAREVGTPAALGAFLKDRLVEAADAIAKMTPEEIVSVIFPESVAPVALGRPVLSSDRLELNPESGGLVCTRSDRAGTMSVCLHFRQTELELPAVCMPFLTTLLERRRFVASEAIAWFSPASGATWASVAPMLDLLLGHGILRLPAE